VQNQEVARLEGQLKQLTELISAILALAEELKAGTIEKQLAKSDTQLGLEWLTRPKATEL